MDARARRATDLDRGGLRRRQGVRGGTQPRGSRLVGGCARTSIRRSRLSDAAVIATDLGVEVRPIRICHKTLIREAEARRLTRALKDPDIAETACGLQLPRRGIEQEDRSTIIIARDDDVEACALGHPLLN